MIERKPFRKAAEPAAEPGESVLGRDLQVGDLIQVWWNPYIDIIKTLTPYSGPCAHIFPDGAQIARLTIKRFGMTIDNAARYIRTGSTGMLAANLLKDRQKR